MAMAVGMYLFGGLVATLVAMGKSEEVMGRTADAFGYLSVGMTCVMYLPQIYLTWLAKVRSI